LENRNAILSLLTAYLNKQVSREEFDRLFSALTELEDEDFQATILQALDNQADVTKSDFIPERVAQLYPELLANVSATPQVAITPTGRSARRSVIGWKLSVAAATIFLFLAAGIYFWQDTDHHNRTSLISAEQIVPGSDRATLTLADGRTVDLSAAKKGIAVGNGIRYLDGTEVIALTADEGKQTANTRLLTLTTPKGGQYQLSLPDGTKVWLNAASSLVYPEAFGDDIREVKLEGEAYFEVTKARNRSFVVNTEKQRVAVLGTSFNISAYSNDEVTKTTLVTGSVRVNILAGGVTQGESRILAPNQQSVIGNQENSLAVNSIDPRTAIAWKDGLFNFHGLGIDEAMKQIERWYDIRVRYEGPKPTGYLGGKMSRGVRLSTFLDFLERDFGIRSELKADRTLVLYATNTARNADL